MSRNAELFIKDILEYMNRAEKYLVGYNLKNFLGDSLVCDAVLRCIEVIWRGYKEYTQRIKKKASFYTVV